jgi:hypothetical protein
MPAFTNINLLNACWFFIICCVILPLVKETWSRHELELPAHGQQHSIAHHSIASVYIRMVETALPSRKTPQYPQIYTNSVLISAINGKCSNSASNSRHFDILVCPRYLCGTWVTAGKLVAESSFWRTFVLTIASLIN